MKKIQLAYAMTLLSLPLTCNAASDGPQNQTKNQLQPSYEKCLDAHADQPLGWNHCISSEYKYQDGRLNKTYSELMGILSEREKIMLRDNERAWLLDRDASCMLSIGATKKNALPYEASLSSSDCVLELTAERAAYLEIASKANDIVKAVSLAPMGKATGEDSRAFVDADSRVLVNKTGFLNDDSRLDALLVVEPSSSGQEKNGGGPSRTILLFTRNAAGQLQKVQQNNKIVPCEICGGLIGDPFGSVQIAKHRFLITTSGGSRERWSNIYAFKYSSAQKDWLLNRVVRSIEDAATQRYKQTNLTPSDFGTIRFEDFDPLTLPNIDFP